ncbi:MAG: hypothetical protein ACFBRM_10120 [Pikeienuella sp.]
MNETSFDDQTSGTRELDPVRIQARITEARRLRSQTFHGLLRLIFGRSKAVRASDRAELRTDPL